MFFGQLIHLDFGCNGEKHLSKNANDYYYYPFTDPNFFVLYVVVEKLRASFPSSPVFIAIKKDIVFELFVFLELWAATQKNNNTPVYLATVESKKES